METCQTIATYSQYPHETLFYFVSKFFLFQLFSIHGIIQYFGFNLKPGLSFHLRIVYKSGTVAHTVSFLTLGGRGRKPSVSSSPTQPVWGQPRLPMVKGKDISKTFIYFRYISLKDTICKYFPSDCTYLSIFLMSFEVLSFILEHFSSCLPLAQGHKANQYDLWF